MKNQINLNIKTPCTEKFQQFAPTAQGGFCGSCQKEVIDFTKMTTDEILAYFKYRETQNTCGRFNINQLKPNNQPRKKISFWSGLGLACLSFFSIHTTQAQEIKKQPETSDKNPSEVNTSKSEKNILVKGNVYSEKIPLPGVTVMLEGTTIGTQADFDGYFEFPEKLKKGDVLVFSYIGMISQKAVIVNEDSAAKIELNIDMKMDACIIMGKVAVKEVYKSKRK